VKLSKTRFNNYVYSSRRNSMSIDRMIILMSAAELTESQTVRLLIIANQIGSNKPQLLSSPRCAAHTVTSGALVPRGNIVCFRSHSGRSALQSILEDDDVFEESTFRSDGERDVRGYKTASAEERAPFRRVSGSRCSALARAHLRRYRYARVQ